MTGIHTVLDTDRILKPHSPFSVLIRGGLFYSVNHYRAGYSASTGEKLPERVEIRYQLTKEEQFIRMQVINPVL